jgi:molecular chaperone DnaK
LKEYGEKLSEGNKTAIEGALTELKAAHASQDLAGIDAGLEKLNAAWTAASQEMYAAGATEGGEGAQASDSTSDNSGAEDVSFEEVK